MTDPAFKAMSVEEYLRTEEKSPVKREYVAGFVYPLYAVMRLRMDEQNAFYYPDVMLVCDTATGSDMAETAPCLLVEVLSPSTAQIDRVGKWAMYTALPSLQTYLIVHQDERRVVEYARAAEGWQMREVVQEGGVSVPCLGLTLTLEDVYGGVF